MRRSLPQSSGFFSPSQPRRGSGPRPFDFLSTLSAGEKVLVHPISNTVYYSLYRPVERSSYYALPRYYSAQSSNLCVSFVLFKDRSLCVLLRCGLEVLVQMSIIAYLLILYLRNFILFRLGLLMNLRRNNDVREITMIFMLPRWSRQSSLSISHLVCSLLIT